MCLFLRARAPKKESREHFEYFVNFALAGISLLLRRFAALRQVIVNNLAHTSKNGIEVAKLERFN